MNKVSFIKALLEMDEASFTKKYNDSPKLKGGQKNLPDELQAQLVKKEDKYTDQIDSSELQMLKKLYSRTPTDKIKAMIDKLEAKSKKSVQETTNESQDHEVSMAQNSLKSIISAASQLMNSIGQDEKDIPAWIQDHITNSENYINQASKNYHEYNEGATSEYDMDELPDGTEEELAGDAEDTEMNLKSMMEDLFEGKKKKPSAGLTKKQKSAVVKKAKAGKDIGKKGKGFEDVVAKAKEGGAKNPRAVAASAMWKGVKKRAHKK